MEMLLVCVLTLGAPWQPGISLLGAGGAWKSFEDTPQSSTSTLGEQRYSTPSNSTVFFFISACLLSNLNKIDDTYQRN